MESFKKSEEIPISWEGELKAFTRLVSVSPDYLSFYLSLGISTLESLILQGTNSISQDCWDRLKKLNSTLTDEDNFLIYLQLIEIMSSSKHDAETKLSWLNNYMQNNLNNAAEALAFSIKEIINCYRRQLSLDVNYSENVVINDARILLQKFAEDVGLFIAVAYNGSKETFYNGEIEIAPIISLFCDNSCWGVLYHQDFNISKIDANDTNHFPFLYVKESQACSANLPNEYKLTDAASKSDPRFENPILQNKSFDEMSDEESSESDIKAQSLNEAVSLLSEVYSQVSIPKTTSEKVKFWLKNISDEIDQYELQNFEKSLNNQKDHEFIYIKCSHSNENRKKYSCGKLHCSTCLKHYVLLQNSMNFPLEKCMCGIVLQIDESIKAKEKVCEVCKINKPKKQFKKIACFSHKVCLTCRVKSFRQSNGSCPLEDREYSNDELKYLNSLSRDFLNYPLRL